MDGARSGLVSSRLAARASSKYEKMRLREDAMFTRREMMKSIGVGSAAIAAGIVGALMPALEAAAAEHAGTSIHGVTVKKLFDYPLEEFPNHSAVIERVDLAPGAASPPHHHPGSVIGYVLSGGIRNQLDQEAVTDYKQGELWYEPPKAVHRVFQNLSKTEPASVLAFMIVPKGKPLTTVEHPARKRK
jgi:quercetin dioxygenase-like cupin family protein